MLISLAMVLSFIEANIILPVPVPGIKLGLTNITVIFALYILGPISAFNISLIRVLLVNLTFGNFSIMIYSLGGALLSLIVMYILKRLDIFSIVGVSIAGGIFHNIGQLLIAFLVIKGIGLWVYLPVLIMFGAVMGALVGTVSNIIVYNLKKYKYPDGR